MRELHFSLVDVGVANKIVSVWASILGSVIGGVIMLRLSLFRTLLIFGILQALSNLPFVWLAIVGKNYYLLLLSAFSESFFAGLSGTAFVAFMMSLCNKRYSASQFALLTAFPQVTRVYAGPLAAALVTSIGWPLFYVGTIIFAIPGLILLFVLKNKLATAEAT